MGKGREKTGQESVNYTEFTKRFETDEQRREFLFNIRRPEGFVRPHCRSKHFCEFRNRRACRCLDCGHRASVPANTIFHRSHFNRRKSQSELFPCLLKACLATNSATYKRLVAVP